MKKKNAENKYIDLNTCYFPEEEIPDEFMGVDSLLERQKSPVNLYLITEDFTLFMSRDSAIKLSEHFKENGKLLEALLEDTIIYGKSKM